MRTANSYQAHARSTAIYPSKNEFEGLMYTALGLAGEAGEFANKVKKLLRDEGGKMSTAAKLDLAKELGDVQWYLANAAIEIGYSLSTIMEANILKLEDRQARGALAGAGDDR